MTFSDLKFFTNEPERDLYTRFAAILKSNTQFFDVLVGYFRSSGFFSMYEALESVEKIRILVGLNVDLFTVKILDLANDEYTPVAVSTKKGKEILEAEVEQEFSEAETSAEVEQGVRIFIDWLKSGKLEMRMYTKAPIHAKVYIMRKDPDKVPDTFGSVITGSSNFSVSGLKNNLEFNVELKDTPDVKFALQHFEALWKDGIDIREAYIEAVEQKTWMRDDITPYELYLKTIYEFFKEEINSDKESIDSLLPPGFMRLQYQIDAVAQAKKKIEAYNGVFISDVVGLGKTYICALLAKSFNKNTRKLIVCPPVLKDYWESVLNDFGVVRFTVESLGKLDHILEKGADKFDYVFVDEAHRFRNSDTDGFSKLHEICRGKKVILISATPINNYTSDIENQIYLFQAKQSGTINGIKNIEGFFRGLNSKLAKKEKEGPAAYRAQLRENSEVIRDRLIREVMIRRTRGEVQKYYGDDLKAQGLTFPKAGSPEKIIYEFDEETDATFSETILAIKDFKYARYTPLLYLKDKKKYSTLLAAQRNMGGFMKGILVKRLESSFFAFSMTLGRFIDSYKQFIRMYNSGKVYISKKVNVYDLLDDGDDTNLRKLEQHIEQKDVWAFESSEFEPRFIRDLRNDLTKLEYLRDLWHEVTTDPKLVEFRKQLLTNPVIKGKKAIVFTESTETAEYLYNNLQDIYGKRIVWFSGKNSDAAKVEIEDSFNPKFKDKDNDKYDFLITTDVLAEGINLHRANVLINYDLPWNPTRIMQRVGRINRVGTEFDRIYVFNFFPTAQSAKQMPLEDRILEKLQSFHDTLGEDYKYLSDAEEVSAQKLFSDLSRNLDDEEESTNPELAYLAVIRGIRDKDPELFNRIKRLPLKAKTAKADSSASADYTVTFIRKGALKTFFRADVGVDSARQMSFIDAIKLIECDDSEPKMSMASPYYSHLKMNSMAFDDFVTEQEEISLERPMVAGNDKKVINALKGLKSNATLTDIEEDKVAILIKRCENGELPSKITKTIVKELGQPHSDLLELYHAIMNCVPESYFTDTKEAKTTVSGKKEIILSCYLCGGKA
ncbi:MAG: helicase [Clostridiales bacterium]|nr:helicase [Clostridiales bacterium]